MNSPTSPASAPPPPMVPSAWKIVKEMCFAPPGYNGREVLFAQDAIKLVEKAHRDGWSAALAAQPPEPPPQFDGRGLRIKSTPPQPHDLYKTGDPDAPDVIKDRNGEVVLGLCRRCNKGEIELEQPCTLPQPGDAEDLAIYWHRIAVERWNAANFMQKELDAAQSALAESQKNAASYMVQRDRLAEECDRYHRDLAESRAEVTRLKVLLDDAHEHAVEAEYDNLKAQEEVVRLRALTPEPQS